MALADTAKLIASLSLKDGFTGPLKSMDKALSGFDKHLDKTQGRAFTAGQQIGNGIKNGTKLAIAAISGLAVAGTALVVSGIRSASDLSETISKVGVVFRDQAASILAFGKTSAEGLGLSENAALSAAATYGNLFVSMGLTSKKSADMSKSLVQLASDLASFNNIDPSEAADKLRAGLTGESEPLKSLGININETIIKNRALELGLVKLGKGQKKYTDVLPAAARAQAAYSLILEQSKTAQGDFGRTQAGLANQTRILKANWEDLKATLGTPILPKVAKILQRINVIIKDNIPLIARFGDKVAGLFSDDNLSKAEDTLKDIFGTVKAFLPAVRDAAEITGKVIKTSVDAFKSLPKEIQALAIAGLAVNKLTGGLVTNIAGGLISAVISSFRGLMNVNAAAVTVNGPVAGIPGAGGPASLFGTASKFIIPVAIVSIGSEAALAISGVNDPQHKFTTADGQVRIMRGTNVLDERILNVQKNIEALAKRAEGGDKDAQRKLGDQKTVLERLLHEQMQTSGRQLDGIGELNTTLSNDTLSVDVANTAAIAKAMSKEDVRGVIRADQIARGIKASGPSKSVAPRLQFLAGNASDAKDVAVAAALALGFERNRSPAFKTTKALEASIKALRADQKTLGPKAAEKVGGFIDRMKAELARRQAATTAAIKAQKTSFTLNASIPTSIYMNGRLLDAQTSRFKTTIVGHKGTFQEFG